MTNLGYIKYRMALHLNADAAGTDVMPGTDVQVRWIELSGGAVDPVTLATQGGVETLVSGVLRGFGVEEPARSVVRQYAEIEVGDVILDVMPDGPVTVYGGQIVSGVVPLDSIAAKGVRFEYPLGSGRWYAQAVVGEELLKSWSVVVGGTPLHRTLHLRKAT